MARRTIPRPRKPVAAERFTKKLLAWFRRSARDLPWRKTRDPYRVLVSEFMLQQTQVSRVEEYYPRFIKRFPTMEHLARAKPKAVMEEWEGLGYYARARNLHALAKSVAKKALHDATLHEQIPSEPEALIKLPGVGRYTAGAVASFAYEKPVPAVDTNVARVIGRAFFGSRLPAPDQMIWDLTATLVPKSGKRAWKFNQAIMELGAVVCVARKPRCPICPVNRECRTGRKLTGRLRRSAGAPGRANSGAR